MPLEIQLRSAQPIDLDADILVVGVPQATAQYRRPAPVPQAAQRSPWWRPRQARREGGLHRKARPVPLACDIGTTEGGAPRCARAWRKAPARRRSGAHLRIQGGPRCERREGEDARLVPARWPRGQHLRIVAEGLELGAYRFTKYLTGDRKPKAALVGVTVAVSEKLKPNAKALVALGQQVGCAVNVARDLSNEPGNVIYPETFAAAAEKLAKQANLPDSGLRLQGDPSSRDEAHRRGGARQLSRAAIRAHLVDAQGREEEARLRRQGHHLRQRGPQHQARRRNGRDEARHERRRERRGVDDRGRGHQAEGGGARDRCLRREHARRRTPTVLGTSGARSTARRSRS